MNKQITLAKIYIAYALSTLSLPVFFIVDVFASIVNGIIKASAEVKYDVYWNTRKMKSSIKMLDLS